MASFSVVFWDSEAICSFDGGGKNVDAIRPQDLPLFRCTLRTCVSIRGIHYLCCIACLSSSSQSKCILSLPGTILNNFGSGYEAVTKIYCIISLMEKRLCFKKYSQGSSAVSILALPSLSPPISLHQSSHPGHCRKPWLLSHKLTARKKVHDEACSLRPQCLRAVCILDRWPVPRPESQWERKLRKRKMKHEPHAPSLSLGTFTCNIYSNYPVFFFLSIAITLSIIIFTIYVLTVHSTGIEASWIRYLVWNFSHVSHSFK